MTVHPNSLADLAPDAWMQQCLLNCTGEAAWQTVFHFHIHVIPRFKDQPDKDAIGLPWDVVPSNLDEIKRIGAQLS